LSYEAHVACNQSDQCAPGKYGNNCNSICPSCDSVGGVSDCSRSGTGVCSCNANFIGSTCSQCVPGKYGINCNLTCPSWLTPT